MIIEWMQNNPGTTIIIIVNIILTACIIYKIKQIMNMDKNEVDIKEDLNEMILDDFIKEQEELSLGGSGDDEVYGEQIGKYINKQRGLWLALIDKLK